ncbi:MAG TPA: regulatory iron-sulfur-containing complex subunit RicT [Phycisphaerae bacterium]|nr:regulatory iron-sulfur-containing complex subunit RicT [Phycisphaerae bacterium]
MVATLAVLNNKPDQYGGASFSPSGCNPNHKCGNGLEKIYPTCAVRYGYMGYIGEFRYAPGMLFGCGAKVVVQTSRGIEIGQQVSLTCTGCDKSIKRQQVLDYAKNSGPDFYRLKSGRILREATPQDLLEEKHLNDGSSEKLSRARELARQHGLTMKFVACEHLFGGERLVFHFMSEDRVDFRDLVRDLAHDFHTRIEMHQVGARDEARLVADYEICGRECCCKNFLKTLRPVSMRMAKLQKATLDPAKVSGRCGRLRCCLRYEHEGYEELNKKLPRLGLRVRTDRGAGTIRDRQILTQLLTIEYDSDGLVETVGLEEVVEQNVPMPDVGEQRPAADRYPGRGTGDRDRRPPIQPANPPRPIRPQVEAPPANTDNMIDRPGRDGPPDAPSGDMPETADQNQGTDRPHRGRRRRRRGRRHRPPEAGGPAGAGPGDPGPGFPPGGQG